MPNIVLLGPPGSGKGTQASFLKEKFNFFHISTGDLIREEIQNNTALGKKLQEFFSKGLLVPDALVIEILRNTIENVYYRSNASLLLDGFPRTIEQYHQLECILNDYDQKIDCVFYFKIDEETVVKRLTGRRLCPKCNIIYHIETKPSRKGDYCEQCGEKLIQRDDDKESTIRKRLAEYNSKTAPLLTLYRNSNILVEIDANRKPEEVFNEISSKISTL